MRTRSLSPSLALGLIVFAATASAHPGSGIVVTTTGRVGVGDGRGGFQPADGSPGVDRLLAWWVGDELLTPESLGPRFHRPDRIAEALTLHLPAPDSR
jgi:hypothetical protein